jgi:hypothetical protein
MVLLCTKLNIYPQFQMIYCSQFRNVAFSLNKKGKRRYRFFIIIKLYGLAFAHCQFSEFSFTFISVFSVGDFQHNITCSRIFSWNCNVQLKKNWFHKKKFFQLSFNFFFFNFFFLRILIASYGARVRGSVFNMKFRTFSREFESIETSLGFAQLLGENWV